MINKDTLDNQIRSDMLHYGLFYLKGNHWNSLNKCDLICCQCNSRHFAYINY